MPAARAFLAFQIETEKSHSDTYGLLMQQFIQGSAEQADIRRAIYTAPAAGVKAR